MKKVRIFSLEVLLALFIGLFSSYQYLNNNLFFENINKKVTDYFLLYRGKINPSGNIVIIDIDEKSIEELGQWPWSRDTISQILYNLANYGTGIIGLDIVFAEADKTSSKKILEKFGFSHEDAYDNDEILATTLQNTPTILGYMFDFKNKIHKGTSPSLSTIVVEKNKAERAFIPQAKGYISNIDLLQQYSFTSGFFNTIPDNDGVVRSAPLLISYDDTIYPSLTLEMIRLILGENKIVVNYSEIGIESIAIGESLIPTDRFGRLFVNYYGASKTFEYISAVDIFNKKISAEKLEGKVALFGTSASGILDLRATPLDSVFPGVEVHANVLENILYQNFIANPSWIEGADILILFLLLSSIVLIFTFFGPMKTALFFLSAMGFFIYFSYKSFIDYGIVLNIIYPFFSSIILYMFLTTLHYLFESRQKDRIKSKFSKKVSSLVVEELMNHSSDALEGKEEEITIFFSDIRGFTSISEAMPNAKALIDLLNIYMTPMVEIIVKHKGTVDKFIGDAIMAYWNAPVKVANHADAALIAAIEQIQALEEINKLLEKENKPFIDIGIGLNSGVCVVGEMGSLGRSDYTCIGDPVNLASRTEGLCKTYGAKIILTQFTKELLKEEYTLIELDRVRVKGKEEPIRIYECYGKQDYRWKEYDSYLLEFEEAKKLYNESDFNKAFLLFQTLYDKTKYKIFDVYKQRCEYYMKNPPQSFDGVFTFETK